MKQQQSGFTLIELIAVIVILGIIAATAIPRFVDLSTAARQASVNAVASSLQSASALNYAAFMAEAAGLDSSLDVDDVTACENVADLLEGGLTSEYQITAAPIPASEASAQCVVQSTEDTAVEANFTAYRVET